MSYELLRRIITAIILVAVLGTAIFFGGWLFWLAVLIISLLAFYEYQRFFKEAENKPLMISTLILGLLYYVGLFLNFTYALPVALFLVIVWGAGVIVFKYPKYTYKNLMTTVFGFAYTIVLPSAFYLLRGVEQGLLWIVFIVITVILSDIFAFFVGKLLGKRKISPLISPKKSVAGLVGGVIAGAIGGSLFGFFFLNASLWKCIVVSVLMILVGVLGDLFESHLKREAGVKDSGNVLPGHGGILDRMDSLLFASGFVYLILVFIQM